MSTDTLLPPVLGFVAGSGTGKTTLLVKVIPLLRGHGMQVGMIKHAHHEFDIDTPGKDSYELRKAGAEQMLVASSKRWALMVENQPPAEPNLQAMLQQLTHDKLHLILVEGFKHDPSFPKIEVHRSGTGKPLLFPNDHSIIAVVSDEPLNTTLPLIDINDPQAVAEFIITRFLD